MDSQWRISVDVPQQSQTALSWQVRRVVRSGNSRKLGMSAGGDVTPVTIAATRSQQRARDLSVARLLSYTAVLPGGADLSNPRLAHFGPVRPLSIDRNLLPVEVGIPKARRDDDFAGCQTLYRSGKQATRRLIRPQKRPLKSVGWFRTSANGSRRPLLLGRCVGGLAHLGRKTVASAGFFPCLLDIYI
ncbi:hypothetical protein Psta_3380 [Pirellula staleyi DSM 6068]|uniref:Uncharacterized protein n=1 Tax=Pirellula staleyi (strain ATCC 27377 / DSM 6068 / ICPB 4128) TaxID=530564 RepID=D2QXW7_PIRSD|nr:hypothetical protein Psta_3380 [Pirellula staleyi DSM 6068]